MANDVKWTKIILETFMEESGLNDRIALGDEKAIIYEKILRTRIAGWKITKQATEFNISVDTAKKYIKELKELYDNTQKLSIILPVRKTSKIEDELDEIS